MSVSLRIGRRIFNPALDGKTQKWQQNGGEFDKPLFWCYFCASRSPLIP
jgi:hypothetical protein